MDKRAMAEQRRQTIKALYVKGLLSCEEIAERMGVTRQSIHALLRRMGVNTSKVKLVVECFQCGSPVEKNRKEYRRNERHFCSTACYQKHMCKQSVHDELQTLKVARDRVMDLLPMGWTHGLAVFPTEGNDVLVFPSREDLLEWKRTGLPYSPFSINQSKRITITYGDTSENGG